MGILSTIVIDDVLVRIFEWIDGWDLLHTRISCKRFRDLMTNRGLFRLGVVHGSVTLARDRSVRLPTGLIHGKPFGWTQWFPVTSGNKRERYYQGVLVADQVICAKNVLTKQGGPEIPEMHVHTDHEGPTPTTYVFANNVLEGIITHDPKTVFQQSANECIHTGTRYDLLWSPEDRLFVVWFQGDIMSVLYRGDLVVEVGPGIRRKSKLESLAGIYRLRDGDIPEKHMERFLDALDAAVQE